MRGVRAGHGLVACGEGREACERKDLHVGLRSDTQLRLRDLVAPVAGYPPPEDAELRARSAEHRIAELPVPLRSRATRVVAAADEVMKHDGLTPWGWMVCYSDIATFAPRSTGTIKGEPKRVRAGSKGEAPETPSEPPPAPGSGGSGPTTGG